MYRSATIKLTAWYLALVMAISLAFSVIVYHFATTELSTGLSRQTQRIYREFPVFNNDPFFVRNNDVAISSHHILQNLIYFNLAVLLVAGFASYWLAKRTLAPIETSNEQQKRFVADASHELRTPVTALKMDAEVALLDKDATEEELRTALQSTVEEADKLNLLLNNLLHLSHLESGEIQAAFADISVTSLVTEAIKTVQSKADAKHIMINNMVTSGKVYGHYESLVQVLVILLDNALKYSPEHSKINITSKTESRTLTITVADEGIGIEPQALEHVFDRFYRADKARAGNSGFGLGLSIAKQITDLHHASITLKSAVGRGTKASIHLPLYAPTAP